MMRGNSERVALAAAGEYPLIVAYNQTLERMVARRAPLDWLPLEPAVVQRLSNHDRRQGAPSQRRPALL